MSSATNPRPTAPKPTKRSRILVWLLILTVVGVFISINLMAFGRVKGFEVSPDTLKLRSFSYWQIPLINVQFLPASRARVATKLEAYLTTSGFLSAARKSSPRWDVVSAVGSGYEYEGDAEILRQYLLLEDGEDKHPWVEWSKQRPAMADVLWPRVVKAIQARRYLLIPRLLQVAERSSDASGLSNSLDQLEKDASSWLVELDQQLAADGLSSIR